MKNPTVKEVIEKLSTMNRNAIVCHFTLENDKDEVFSTFEVIREFPNVKYIDDAGDEVVGNVVAIY